MGLNNIFKPLSTVLSSAINNLINFNISTEKKLGALRFKPGAAGWDASMLSIVICDPPIIETF